MGRREVGKGGMRNGRAGKRVCVRRERMCLQDEEEQGDADVRDPMIAFLADLNLTPWKSKPREIINL